MYCKFHEIGSTYPYGSRFIRYSALTLGPHFLRVCFTPTLAYHERGGLSYHLQRWRTPIYYKFHGIGSTYPYVSRFIRYSALTLGPHFLRVCFTPTLAYHERGG